MNRESSFNSLLTAEERILLDGLTTPFRIQQFLDTVQYPSDDRNRSVLNVLRERKAHCLDGGLFGAAALRWLGYPPLIVDLLPEPGSDDDHILAIYRVDGHWGAVAKSNFVGLKFREPIHRNLRELVMSYFNDYFNTVGQKTLRGYTRPIKLAGFDAWNWLTTDEGVDRLEKRLYHYRAIPILTPKMAERLHPTDEVALKNALSTANWDGLFKPKS